MDTQLSTYDIQLILASIRNTYIANEQQLRIDHIRDNILYTKQARLTIYIDVICSELHVNTQAAVGQHTAPIYCLLDAIEQRIVAHKYINEEAKLVKILISIQWRLADIYAYITKINIAQPKVVPLGKL